jgi:hypothetical protein
MSAGLDFRLADRDFKTVDQQDQDTQTSLWVDRTFGRQLALNVSYEHFERAGGSNSGGAFDENSIRLMLQYTPNPSATR